MKWKLFTLSVLMISLIGMCYAEDVSVELIPDNINTHVGDTFNLNLTVKNVPKNATCSGFETCINYNPSILNLTNIKLSDISNNTTLKATNVSSGKISLAWFSNPPYGNFTVATLSFKALNEGSGNISLRKTVISNADGYRIEPLIIKNSSITILPKPIADIITPATVRGELGENITVPIIISPKENETLSEISGTLSYDKTIMIPVGISSNAGVVSFNTSNDFFKIENLNKSTNFTVNVTYNIINVGNATTQLKDVTIKDNKNYSVVKSSDITKIIIPGPDLIITDISTSQLKSYQNNTIPITIKNIGERNASNNFSVALYIDTKDLGTKTISGLNVGETKTINFTFMPLENKNYTIVAVVDSSNVIKEENESNNKYVKTVEYVEEPISLNLIPSTNLTKTDNTFTVDIKLNNITADRPAKGMDGVLTYNSKILKCTNFTFLINATENLKNITFKDGKVVFSIMDGDINTSTTIARATFKAVNVGTSKIGLDGVVVSDANGYKFNNIVINPKTIVVQGPNIKIIDMEISNPSTYRMPTTINITITNNGHQNVNKSFDIKLYANSKDLGTKTISNLSIGENKTVEFNWTPDDTRTYTIVAVVDSSNVIKEENESDNKLVKHIKVVESPVYLTLSKTSENNGIIVASIDAESISSKRPCSGYDINISLKNVKILNVSGIGTNIWWVNNNSLFISGFNFTKSGKFNIGNITFKVINENDTYSVILKHVVLSDNNGYKFNKYILNNNIVGLDYIKNIIKIDNYSMDLINRGIGIISGSEYNITNLSLKTGDDLLIPVVSNKTINLTKDVFDEISNISKKAIELKTTQINDENDMNKTIDNILSEVKPILNEGFNITNITKEDVKKENDKLLSTIKFKAINTSNKGFSIIRIPIGNLDVENIIVNNGTENITLKENNINSNIGWYRIPVKGVLEITLVKDPEVNIILAVTLPTTTTTSPTYYSSGGGSHHHTTITITYPDVAKDIKSEKIKEIVHNAKLIIGSEIDKDLSAKDLKNTTELINQPLEITEDCILVGGPVANPLAKKYLWTFPAKITNNYPGKHKGVIEKQIINGHTVILLAGSDRWGTKAAVEYFKTLDDIPSEPIFVEWKDGKAVKIEKP